MFAVQQLSETAAQQVYAAALDAGNRDTLQKLQEWLPQVPAAVGTAQLTGAQLQKQLASALALQQQDEVVALCQHPAAAEISPAGMQELLQTALQLSVHNKTPQDSLAALVHMQAAQALSSLAVSELMECCLQNRSAEGVLLLSKLPAARQLNQQQCESLLQHAIDAAVNSSNSPQSIQALQDLLKLQAVKALPAQAVVPQLLCCLRHSVPLPVLRLLMQQLPAPVELSTSDVRALLLTAVEAQNADTFGWLRSFLAAPNDEEVQAWSAVLGSAPV